MLPTSSVTTRTQVSRTNPNGTTSVIKDVMLTKSKQARPYNLALAYSKCDSRYMSEKAGLSSPNSSMSASIGYGSTGQWAFDIVRNYSHSTTFTEAMRLVDDVQMKARERFIASFKNEAGIGVDLAERKQAMGMIQKRALQMVDFVRSIRKGKIQHAAEILGVQSHPSYHALVKDLSVRGQLRKARFKRDIELNRRNKNALFQDHHRDYADLFLEFHFGWEPIVRDVYDSIDVLQGEIPAGRIVGKATRPGNLTIPRYGSNPYFGESFHKLRVRCTVGATVTMTNPNLALANQLGLVNPVALAWEVVPWSFVFDWFFTVGEFLNSFTEFAGYNVSDPFTMTYVYDVSTYNQYYGSQLDYSWVSNCMSCTRVLSIPTVTLKVRSPWRLSPTRAATAISLLVQQTARLKSK